MLSEDFKKWYDNNVACYGRHPTLENEKIALTFAAWQASRKHLLKMVLVELEAQCNLKKHVEQELGKLS